MKVLSKSSAQNINVYDTIIRAWFCTGCSNRFNFNIGFGSYFSKRIRLRFCCFCLKNSRFAIGFLRGFRSHRFIRQKIFYSVFFLCIFCAFYCYKSRALVIIFFVLINNFHKHLCFMYTIFTAHSITCLFFRIIVEYVTYNKSYEFCGNSMKQHEIRTNHNNRLFYPRLVC